MYYTKKGQISTRRQLNFKNQQEIWTDTSPNKIYRQQVSMWQDAQYTLMLIKTKWDIPTYQSSWNPKYCQNQMLMRCRAIGTFISGGNFIVGGNEKLYIRFRKQLCSFL